MKTVTYVLRSDPDRDRPLPKVVDLAAWRAEHLMDPDGPLAVDLPARRKDRQPVRRRRTALDRTELIATLAVAVAFLALAARVLLF